MDVEPIHSAWFPAGLVLDLEVHLLLKRYARWAGTGDIRLHQTHHTFARWVSESTGNIIETQDALGHRHAATTRVYVQRVAVKKDRHSTTILDRLDV